MTPRFDIPTVQTFVFAEFTFKAFKFAYCTFVKSTTPLKWDVNQKGLKSNKTKYSVPSPFLGKNFKSPYLCIQRLLKTKLSYLV